MRLALVVALFSAVSCATAGTSGGSVGGVDSGGVATNTMFPDLAYKDLYTGQTRTLTALRGKVVVLDLWASWCAPCKEELPELDAMASRLGDDVVVVALSLDEDREAALDFLRRKKSWRVSFGHDGEGNVGNILAPPKMPTSYVIDRDGVVRHVNAGFSPGDAARIEGWVRGLLARR